MSDILIDYKLYAEYRSLFDCIIAMPEPSGMMTLFSPDRKTYSIDDVPTNEINHLMHESVKNGINLLLEKYKSNEYKIPDMHPDCEY